MIHTCAWTSCLLKVAILHHFPSRVGLCLLRFVSLFIYGLFCRPLSGTTSLPESGLNSCICAWTSYLLKAAIWHYFPSRVWLDACCWRYCLFLEPWLKTLKFLNSPSAQTARIFTRLSQWFYTGNNQRLNNRHLHSDEKYSEGSCSALLPFRSGAVP